MNGVLEAGRAPPVVQGRRISLVDMQFFYLPQSCDRVAIAQGNARPIGGGPMPVETRLNEVLAHRGCWADRRTSPGLPPEGHCHDGIEIGLLHAGGVRYASDSWVHTLYPSGIIVFDGRSTHYTHPVGSSFVRTCIAFLPELVRDPELRDRLDEVMATGAPQLFRTSPDTMRRFTWAANELAGLTRRGSSQRLTARVLEMALVDLYEDRCNGQTVPTAVLAAIEYMQERLEDPVDIAALAKRLYYSESQLRHLFKRSTGYSPQAYWNMLKIERSCALLARSEASVRDIAASVGFASASGFQRAFKRRTGLSPVEYRAARMKALASPGPSPGES